MTNACERGCNCQACQIERLKAQRNALLFHLHGIFWIASNGTGQPAAAMVAVNEIADLCHKLIIQAEAPAAKDGAK